MKDCLRWKRIVKLDTRLADLRINSSHNGYDFSGDTFIMSPPKSHEGIQKGLCH